MSKQEMTEYFIQLANTQYSNGDLEGAENSLNMALQKEPHNQELLAVLGNLYIQQNRYHDAHSTFEKIININPESIDGFINLAIVLLAEGDLQASATCIHHVLSINPENKDALQVNETIQKIQESPDMRQAVLSNRARSGSPVHQNQTSVNTAVEQVKRLYADGNIDDAIKFIEEKLVVEPTNVDLLLLNSNLLMQKQEYIKAKDILNKLTQISRFFAPAYTSLAVIEMTLGDENAAETNFQYALILNPRDVFSLKSLSQIQVNKGQYHDAVMTCHNILLEKPDDLETLISLAGIYFKRNEFQISKFFLSKALKIDPDNLIARDSLISVEEAMEQHQNDEFLSCSMLEKGINFFHDKVTACCYIHGEGQGAPTLFSFTGGDLPIIQVIEARIKLKEEINAGKRTACTDCQLLEKRKSPKTDYLFANIQFNHGTQCNLRCNYCYLVRDEEEMRQFYDVYPIIQKMVDDEILAPKPQITWGGGEPTLMRNFEKLFHLLSQMNASHMVHTNGVRFSPEVYDNLGKSPMTIMTSIDAGTRETYLKIRGRDHFDDVMMNMQKYYQKCPGAIQLKYIITKDNYHQDELEQFIANLEKFEFKNCQVILDIDVFERFENRYLVALAFLYIKLYKDYKVTFSTMTKTRVPFDLHEFCKTIHTEGIGNLYQKANTAKCV